MNQENISRRGYLGIASATSIAGIAGCLSSSGNGQNSQQDNTIHFLNDRSTRDPWEAAAEEFSSESDYNIEITWLPKGTAVNEQLAQMEASGNLPALLVETSSDCYRETLNGSTEPLTDVVEELGIKDTVNVDGESYMAPIGVTPLFLSYRSDIIEGDPQTWSEWQAEAERIQNEQEQAAYAVPAGRTNLATSHTNQILWNSGVNSYSGTGDDIEVTLDQGNNRERAVAAFDWLQAMNGLGPNATGWEWEDIYNALIQENLVAGAATGSVIPQIQANRPDILSDIKPALYPVAEGQDPTQWWGYFEGIYSYQEADHTEGAKEFIRFFFESDYYYEYLRQSAPNTYPASIEGVRDERYTSAEIFEIAPEYIELVENNWDSLSPVLNTGDDGAPNIIASNAYSQQLFGQAADQLLNGNLSSGETVDWLAEQLRQI